MLDMIKCSTGGAYYARGEWVPADGNASAALPKHAATARKAVSEGYYTMKPRKEKALFTNES